MKRILVDTGPLVAIFSPEDRQHETCVRTLRELPGPLLTCWPVLTEVAWLLQSSPRALRQMLGIVDGGVLELLPLAGAEASSIAKIMEKYEDIRPQLADAALVYLADREKIETIFTLDRRDFLIYRSGRHTFRIIPDVQ